MLRKVISAYLIFLLAFSVYGSELAFKKRMNFIKAELIKLTNDKTKTTDDYIKFLNNEINKIDIYESPYDEDFTENELAEIKSYLMKVKKIFEHKEDSESEGIFDTIWGWLVSAFPYIAFGVGTIGAVFLGLSFFGDEGTDEESEEDDESENNQETPPKPIIPEKKPKFGKVSRDLIACIVRNDTSLTVPISWNPDSKSIVYGDSDGSIYVCDILSDQLKLKINTYSRGIMDLSWGPHGKYIASGSFDGTIKIWDPYSWTDPHDPQLSLGRYGFVLNQVMWSPDKKYFAAIGYNHRVYLWNASPSKALPPNGKANKFLEWPEKSTSLLSFAWSPNGNYIVAGGMGKDGGNSLFIKVWNVSTGEIISSVKATNYGYIQSLAWTQINGIDYIISRGSVSPSTSKIGAKVWRFNLTTKSISSKPVAILNDGLFIEEDHLSPDGKYFLTYSESNRLQIWQLPSGKLLSTVKIAESVSYKSLKWSPDGKYVIYKALEGPIKLRSIVYE